MPKRTYKQIAEFHGITKDQVDAAKNKGVNIYSDEELAEHLAGVRHRIKPDAELSEPEAINAETLEEMEEAIRKARSIDDVKILKEKLTALKTAVQVRRETRELISLAEVEERDIRIAAVVKAGILKLCNDSSPMCEGLGAAEIHGVLLRQGTQVLEMMADEQSAFWQEASA